MKKYVIGSYYKIVQKRGPFFSEQARRELIERLRNQTPEEKTKVRDSLTN